MRVFLNLCATSVPTLFNARALSFCFLLLGLALLASIRVTLTDPIATDDRGIPLTLPGAPGVMALLAASISSFCYLGTVLVGIAFGAGWSPCIGPILGAILTYTASEADLQRGMVLLLSYSMGLAIPFIAAALAVDWFLTAFTKFRKYLGYVQKVAGVLLIAVGILMVTNYFTILATALQALTPEFLRSRI